MMGAATWTHYMDPPDLDDSVLIRDRELVPIGRVRRVATQVVLHRSDGQEELQVMGWLWTSLDGHTVSPRYWTSRQLAIRDLLRATEGRRYG